MHVTMTAVFQARRADIVFGLLVTPGERFRARLTHDDLPTLLAECQERLASDLVTIEAVAEVREPWEQGLAEPYPRAA